MKHKIFLTIFVLFISAMAFIYYSKSPNNMDIINTPNFENKNGGDSNVKVHAWIYPGEPACRAEKEMLDIKEIKVLRVEYLSLTDKGEIQLVTEGEFGCNGFSERNINLIKEYSQEQYVTISGSREEMAAFFANEIKVSSGIDIISRFVTDNGITGAEIDFEDFSSWSMTDYSNYKSFVNRLGTELHSKGEKLIVDGPPIGNAEEQSWYKWKYSDFEAMPVDYITVMAYDFQTDQGAGSPISPNKWVSDIVSWTMREISDADKIVIGIPSYGYSSALGTYRFDVLTSEQLASKVGLDNFTYDPESYEYRKEIDGISYTYISQDSLDSKRSMIESMGVKNISVWHLGGNDWFSQK